MTASIYNADHQNHITNHIPSQMGDYSSNAAEMKQQTDPGDVGSESLPTNLAGELERLRYITAWNAGKQYWYTERTDVVYVDNFGAVADGDTSTLTGTDNTSAFQDAIDSLSSTGGTVVFSGIYYLASSLQMVAGVHIRGAGFGYDIAHSTLIGADHVFSFTGEDHVVLSDFEVWGTNASTGAAVHFVSGTSSNIDVARVYVRNQNNAVYVESTATLVDVRITDSTFIYNRSWHVDIENAGTISDLHFFRVRLDAQDNTNNAGHFRAGGPVGKTYFTECLFQSASSTYSIQTDGNVYMDFNGGVFFNNANDSQGVVDAGADFIVLSGNSLVVFNGTRFDGPKSTATNFNNIRVSGSQWSPKVIIRNCTVTLDDISGFVWTPDSYPYDIEVSNTKFIGTPASTPYDTLSEAGDIVKRFNNDQDSDIYRLTTDIVETVTTTDAAFTIIAGGVYNIQPSAHFLLSYEIMGRETDAAGTEYAAYHGAQLWDSAADRTLTSLGSLHADSIESDAALDFEISAASSGLVSAGLRVRVKGLAATTMEWVCRLRIMAVGTGSYPL